MTIHICPELPVDVGSRQEREQKTLDSWIIEWDRKGGGKTEERKEGERGMDTNVEYTQCSC